MFEHDKVEHKVPTILAFRLVPVIYNAIFCFRRLMVILALFLLEDRGFWLIFAFNFVQTLYFYYITNVMPHTEPMHNKLEYFNEFCVIAMQYMAMNFIQDVNMSVET